MNSNISNEKIRECAVAMMETLMDDERFNNKKVAATDVARAKAMCDLVQATMEIQRQETETNRTKIALANMLLKNGYSLHEIEKMGYIGEKSSNAAIEFKAAI